MLDYAQLLGMNGGNAQAATMMQGALQPGASLLGSAGPTPVGQNPMTGGPSRFSMGTAIGEAGQPGTLMGQAAQQVAATPRIQPPAPVQSQAWQPPQQQGPLTGLIEGFQPGTFTPASQYSSAPGTENLYYAPDGGLYRYDPHTKNLAPWTAGYQVPNSAYATGVQRSYGANDGGDGGAG